MGSVSIRLNLNAAGYSAQVAAAQKQMNALANATKQMGHGTVSEVQAASATLRVLEGGMTGNIRAAERFIATLPGVGKALQAIFPIVGGIALIGVFSKITEEVYKTVHALGQIRNVANEGFTAMTEGAHRNADALRVSNDRIEEQIAKLEHKPANNMALALDEARLRADELADSLNKDYEGFKKIVEESQKGMFAALLNKGIDKPLGNQMQDQLANIRTLAREEEKARREGNTASADDLAQKRRTAQQAALSFADSETSKRNGMTDVGGVRQSTYANKYGDQALNFDAINAFKEVVGGQIDVADEQSTNTADQARLKALQQAQAAQVELLKTMQEGIEKQKAQFGVSIADELAYWTARIGAFSTGSDQYHTVAMDRFRLQAELYTQLTEGKKKYLESAKSDVTGNDLLGAGAETLQKLNVAQLERAANATREYNLEVAKGDAEQQKASRSFAETAVRIATAQGAISSLDAAQAMSAIHGADYAESLQRINAELARQIDLINQMPDDKMTAEDKANAIRNANAGADNERRSAGAAFAHVSAQDKSDVSGNTIAGAVRSSLAEMVRSFTDMAANLKNVIPRALESLNGDIAKMLTGQGQKGLVQTGLQGAEGLALNFLSGGKLGPKRDGSTEMAALWVQIAAGQAAAGNMPLGSSSTSGLGGIAGSLASLVPGGSFIQPFLSLLPHFAGGGDVMANHPIMVGENGPEPFIPRTAGTILPTGALDGGGGTTIHVHVNGNQDPMAVNAAVMRAAPHIIAAGVQANNQQHMRMAGGRRR
jgi:hypothetical protein